MAGTCTFATLKAARTRSMRRPRAVRCWSSPTASTRRRRRRGSAVPRRASRGSTALSTCSRRRRPLPSCDAVVVTGAAGFIGSHLAERLATPGTTSSPSTRSPTTTTRRVEAGERSRPGARRARSRPRPSSSRARCRRRRLPPRRAAGRARELRRPTSSCTCAATCSRPQRLFEAAARLEVSRVVFASSSSVYGDAEAYPTPEDAIARPISPYGVTKLCVRAARLRALARTVGLDAVGAPLLHRLRATSAARHGVHAPARGARPRDELPRSSVTAARPAASRTSTTPSRRPSRRWQGAGRARSTTSVAARRRR